MRDRVFLDTNILVYLYSVDEADKRDASFEFVNSFDCITSIQALNEASNVWFRKHNLSKNEVVKYLDEIEAVCEDIMLVRRKTINLAMEIKDRYGYSFFDCLMLASAIEANCSLILTEDMQDGQIIDGTLKITSPFIHL